MTDAELSAIQTRVARATPGPWKPDHWHDEAGMPRTVVQAGTRILADFWNLDDADFVANARTDIPRLLREVERLRGQLMTARARGKRKVGSVLGMC